ncbi:hypothetical protein N7G274_003781 [Stereocaulon virgatum]|uniref:Uncharacterized protein n=1 Tax=Stereocaulon virgatum TaxID=373712 RepID=A0ABR4AFJ3_9LECA
MFCGCGMAFGLRKKTRRKEATEGVSEEAPHIIDICQGLSITREGGLLDFHLDPAAMMDKSRFRRSSAPSPESGAELSSQCEAEDEQETGVFDLDEKEGPRSLVA